MRSEQNACHDHAPPVAQGNNGENEHIIWLGDFNHHHPMWEPPNNMHLFTAANLDTAGVLINLLALYNLTQILPPSLATLEASNTKNHTRPDNVFCSAELEHAFTQCDIKYHLQPVITDHYPVISSLDFCPEHIDITPRLNYREVDWDEFNEALSQQLNAITPPVKLTTKEQFNTAFTKLTQVITET